MITAFLVIMGVAAMSYAILYATGFYVLVLLMRN
jgi:hypothetical protein